MKEKNNESLFQRLMEDPVEIPESLAPENIKKKLESMEEQELEQARQEAQKRQVPKRGNRYRMAAAAACIAVTIAVTGVVVLKNTSGTDTYQVASGRSGQGETESSAHQQGAADPDGSANSEGDIGNGENAAADPDGGANAEGGADNGKNYADAYKNLKKIKGIKDKGEKILYEAQDVDGASSMAEGSTAGSSNSGGGLASDSAAGSAGSYSKTNVRTEGVDEGDIVKTDGKTIYAANTKGEIEIFRVNNGKTDKIGTITLPDAESIKSKYAYYDNGVNDMYLSGSRLTVVVGRDIIAEKTLRKAYEGEGADYKNFCKDSWEGGADSYMCVEYTWSYVYDVSNPENPELMHTFFQDGNYMQSRLVDGILYVFSSRTMNTEGIKKKKINTYIPQVGGECVKSEDIVVQDVANSPLFTVISTINTNSCEYIDKKAVLGGADDLYVSGENIYLTDYWSSGTMWWYKGKAGDQSSADDKSSITRLSYKDGKIKQEASGHFRGFLQNDYSIDEFNGYLRVVTTSYGKDDVKENGLYILDKDLKVTGKLTGLAPDEDLHSARFLGDTVYFVTFRTVDPLFAADVSDPANPKMLGKLKIPGFSDYLHPYSDHLLLGIGYDADKDGMKTGVKISMFDISDPSDVKEVAKEVLPDCYSCEVTENPNALYIETDKNRFGFGIVKLYQEHSNKKQAFMREVQKYMVYSYDEKKGFVKKLEKKTWLRDYDARMPRARGIAIGGYFYIAAVAEKTKLFSIDEITS